MASEAALSKLIVVSDRMSQFEARINTSGTAEHFVYTCQIRRDQVRALWEKLEREYEICCEAIFLELAGSLTPVVQAKYYYCYKVYEKCEAQLCEQIEKASNIISSGCRLPPCDTEVFSGDYLRWPTIRDLFTAIYVNNPRQTEVEKLFHLYAKTTEDAPAIFSRSSLTNDGFKSAWDNFMTRFENRRLL